MSLTWLGAAGLLYLEIIIVSIMSLPIISSPTWQKIFKLRIFQTVASSVQIAFYSILVCLAMLFADSLREAYKFHQRSLDGELYVHPGAETENNMRMFRAQRNIYISGCSLFFLVVIHRLQKLISYHAVLLAANEAFRRQAESASATASRLIDENARRGHGPSDSSVDGDDGEKGKKGVPLIQAELERKVAELTKQLESKESELSAIKSQAEGVSREYDNLLKEMDCMKANSGDKKDD